MLTTLWCFMIWIVCEKKITLRWLSKFKTNIYNFNINQKNSEYVWSKHEKILILWNLMLQPKNSVLKNAEIKWYLNENFNLWFWWKYCNKRSQINCVLLLLKVLFNFITFLYRYVWLYNFQYVEIQKLNNPYKF